MIERAFFDPETSVGELKLNPTTERDRLQKLFDEARADQQANYPDLYVSTAATPRDAPDLKKQLEDAKTEAAKIQSEMLAKIEALTGKLASKVDAQIESAVQSVTKE